MRRTYLSLALTISAVLAVGPSSAFAQGVSQLQQLTSTTSPTSAITQTVYGKPFKITGLATGQCLTLDANSLLTVTPCSSGASFVKAWEVNAAGYLAPTTTIAVLLPSGFVSQASSTIGIGTSGGGLTVNGSATSTSTFFAPNISINNVAPTLTNRLSVTGATGDVGIAITGITTGGGIQANSVTTGTAYSATGITNGVALNYTPTTAGRGLLFNSTSAALTTASGLSINGAANMTADYTGSFIVVTPTRNVAAAATRIHSGNMLNIDPIYSTSGSSNSILTLSGTTTVLSRILSNASTGASAAINVSAPVVEISNSTTATRALTDTSTLLSLLQMATSSTGTALALNNAGNGNLATFMGSGNFGIGSTSPFAKLSVTGAGSATGVNFQTTNSSETPVFTVLDNGNVGIGSSTPTSRIGVTHTTNSLVPLLTATGFDNDNAWTPVGLFNESGTPTFVIYMPGVLNSTGNIGLGTSTPQARLTVDHNSTVGTITNGILINDSDTGTTWSTTVPGVVLDFGSNDTSGTGYGTRVRLGSVMEAVSGGSSRLGIFTAPTTAGTMVERLSILSGGNVGIGTTSPWARLSVEGISSLGSQAIAGYFTATSTTASTFASSVGIASSSPAFPLSVNNTGSDFYVTTTGKVVAQDTANAFAGRISPTRRLVIPFATSTGTWSATSTAGVDVSPEVVPGFIGSIRSFLCQSNTFLGVTIKINGAPIVPSYVVASSTVGNINVTASNIFTSTDRITMDVGTTTTATASSGVVRGSCTIQVTETP